MKFFLDTANLEEIKRGLEMGLVDGVTTNPTLVSKEGMEFWDLVTEICRLVEGPVSLEVTSLEAEGMVREARELAKIGENVVVKIPMTQEGIKAVKRLSAEGIKTNVTLVFTNYDIFTEVIVASVRHPMHVLEAALIGADIATVPFRVMEQLFKHPLTDIGIERFLKDWEKVPRKREL